ncbi:hypothetical protein DERP_005512 [Dermatophagoides pteronyssinus]|uniref:Uncharacterized protein n=1 Tax=Dermatophagoides pteronyssinus TaxID=6956 RepID=A0ABQ8JNC2_DERPT|nr:hypothetical protein DERP_005512 [Dermatophagoides pteronyssinus]
MVDNNIIQDIKYFNLYSKSSVHFCFDQYFCYTTTTLQSSLLSSLLARFNGQRLIGTAASIKSPLADNFISNSIDKPGPNAKQISSFKSIAFVHCAHINGKRCTISTVNFDVKFTDGIVTPFVNLNGTGEPSPHFVDNDDNFVANSCLIISCNNCTCMADQFILPHFKRSSYSFGFNVKP